MTLRILISTSTFAADDSTPLKRLQTRGVDVQLNPFRRRMKESEVSELLQEMDGVIAGTEPITRQVLERASRLRVISRCGAGLDNIDLTDTRKRGIQVFRTPDAPALAVAELSIGMILSALRGIPAQDAAVKQGIWAKETGTLLSGKTIGIVGTGAVGRKLIELLQPFRPTLLATDVHEDPALLKSFGVQYVSLEDLLGRSDVISIHLPLLENTVRMFDAKRFEQMKQGPVFLNTSRGEIVVEEDLQAALQNGTVGFACLDVFGKEPYQGPLTKEKNVILTPHIGSYAREARVQMENESVTNLLKGLGLE